MKNEKEEKPRCANEGCGKPADDDDSRYCAACGLERMLLRRDTRRDTVALGDRMLG
jgi:ribosomal protein L37E